MKLRNKRTGEIIGCKEILILREDSEGIWQVGQGSSLAELNEEWEDYAPKEPLIKDDKIRKAVRAWAKANNINFNYYDETDVKFNSQEHEFTWIDTSIQFNEITGLENLKHGKRYTIAELCGEEEEVTKQTPQGGMFEEEEC